MMMQWLRELDLLLPDLLLPLLFRLLLLLLEWRLKMLGLLSLLLLLPVLLQSQLPLLPEPQLLSPLPEQPLLSRRLSQRSA